MSISEFTMHCKVCFQIESEVKNLYLEMHFVSVAILSEGLSIQFMRLFSFCFFVRVYFCESCVYLLNRRLLM